MRLTGKKVIALVDDEFEDLELWYPVYRVREEGAEVHLAGLEKGKTYVGKYGVPAQAEYAWDDLDAADYDGILVPGGWAPDKIRRYSAVLKLVQDFHAARKPIGQICQAGWVLISAKILDRDLHARDPGRYGERRRHLEGRAGCDGRPHHIRPPSARPSALRQSVL